jgi:hypothetical protein
MFLMMEIFRQSSADKRLDGLGDRAIRNCTPLGIWGRGGDWRAPSTTTTRSRREPGRCGPTRCILPSFCQSMQRKRKRRSRSSMKSNPLVQKHLPEISRALLEGENKEKFVAFLKDHEEQGLYALYRKNGELYYVGRASNLLQRLSTHTSDLHGKKWDKLAIYIIDQKLTLHDVESLLIAVSKPEGNKNRGKLKGDLKKDLKDFMKTAAIEEINASLYPNQEPKESKKNRRITEKKIDAFIQQNGVARTAEVLGVSAGRVSQLRGEQRLRRWVIAAGKREKMLIAIETTKAKKATSAH